MLTEEEQKILEDLLFNEECGEKITDYLGSTTNPYFLHRFAAMYNYDDGFEILNCILNNRYCDSGTALQIFFMMEGESLFFQEKKNYLLDENSTNWTNEWKQFIQYLYQRILDDDFQSRVIQYQRRWSKVELYNINKNNIEIPLIFLEGTNREK